MGHILYLLNVCTCIFSSYFGVVTVITTFFILHNARTPLHAFSTTFTVGGFTVTDFEPRHLSVKQFL